MQLPIRPMTSADIVACHHLSQQLQWPHRPQDWQFLLQIGHGVVIEMHNDGQAPVIVGTALHFNLGQDHASLGMVIVQPEMQGHGLGRRLMQTLLDQTDGRVRMLNATEAGRPLYEKLGFVATGATHQYQGAHLRPTVVPLPAGVHLRSLNSTDIARIQMLDTYASGMDRSHVLAALSGLAEGVVIERAGDVIGFALIRPFGRGRLIGPVVAPDVVQARAMIAYLATIRPDDFIRIDIFASTGLGPWLDGIGLEHVDSIVPMRLERSRPRSSVSAADVQLFSVIAQALG
jgi:GNAT superfamily N-acetyltransferase